MTLDDTSFACEHIPPAAFGVHPPASESTSLDDHGISVDAAPRRLLPPAHKQSEPNRLRQQPPFEMLLCTLADQRIVKNSGYVSVPNACHHSTWCTPVRTHPPQQHIPSSCSSRLGCAQSHPGIASSTRLVHVHAALLP